MNLSTKIKSYIIESIGLLYALLFIYAAVSKILDFENFQVQIGQSPLLSVFAIWISWIVPIIELIIATIILIPRYRKLGIYAGLALMTMFTVYIYIVLHYASFIPCSCGGILEKMSWDMHLIFNLLFTLLGFTAIMLFAKNNQEGEKKNFNTTTIKTTILIVAISSFFIVGLYLFSERTMQKENPFIRRYPQHPVSLHKTLDLKFNSYYFAGYSDGLLYLGNYTDPLSIIGIDSELKIKMVKKIEFKNKSLPFRMVKIAVCGSNFYLMDGTVPCIFKGKITDWKITKELKNVPHFTLSVPIDSTSFAIRSLKGKNASHVLGVFSPGSNPETKYNTNLLHQQMDGVFDTDGILAVSEKERKMIYLYYYRNEFVVADKNANQLFRGHTIDTVSHAAIKVSYLKEGLERAMSAPPLIVNKRAALQGNILFVESKIPGRFEPQNIWKQAVIIDVYNIKKNSYVMSFALYKMGAKKLSSFFASNTHFYVISENELAVYTISELLKKEIDYKINK